MRGGRLGPGEAVGAGESPERQALDRGEPAPATEPGGQAEDIDMSRTDTDRATAHTTPAERAVVLGGFALAALGTVAALLTDSGLEAVATLWLAAAVWAFVSSLVLALRRGCRHRDWSAFRHCEITDNTEAVDFCTKTGEYAWMRVAEEHERLMRGD